MQQAVREVILALLWHLNQQRGIGLLLLDYAELSLPVHHQCYKAPTGLPKNPSLFLFLVIFSVIVGVAVVEADMHTSYSWQAIDTHTSNLSSQATFKLHPSHSG